MVFASILLTLCPKNLLFRYKVSYFTKVCSYTFFSKVYKRNPRNLLRLRGMIFR